ncbi:Ctr copper transporter family-domain-containing protein [Aspergillus karnatakaensis]|uniref:copper transporter family protein n=1 Tax=Aspergillus karnatakaensis TaxID=1810916 RepID=UPI003CCD2545
MNAHSLLPRHGGMDMGSSATNVTCTTEMIWNWNTIDTCFLASTWHVTTKAMFAVSCIGVALLGVSLEFLRRVTKDYEEGLQRQFHRHALSQLDDPLVCGAPPSVITYRASPIQQVIRAILHVTQFGVAYITMLIAMYYNGYMIISILIGAFLGKLFFDWGQYRVVLGQTQGPAEKVQEEATKCCG